MDSTIYVFTPPLPRTTGKAIDTRALLNGLGAIPSRWLLARETGVGSVHLYPHLLGHVVNGKGPQLGLEKGSTRPALGFRPDLTDSQDTKPFAHRSYIGRNEPHKGIVFINDTFQRSTSFCVLLCFYTKAIGRASLRGEGSLTVFARLQGCKFLK